MAALAALLTLGVLFQQVALRRQRRRFAPPGRMVDVGGHRLHVDCAGSGSPVVVLESGIAASSLSWSVVQPRIAMFTRVCSYQSCRPRVERSAIVPEDVRQDRR